MRVAAFALALAACGRFGFGARSGADASFDTRAPDTATSDTGPCVWSAFSAPMLLPGPIQSPADDWAPTPTAGGLQIFMHTYRASSVAQIWTASRPTTADPFSAATEVTELATGTSQQFDPTLTDDGLRIMYGDSKTASFDLYEAVRATPTGTFGTPVALTVLNSAATDWNPWLSGDGLRLMFTSGRNASYDQIYETTRPSLAAQFAAPMLHAELTVVNANQWNPTLSADGLTIFFSSQRSGGPGGFDVYTAQRPALGQPFSNIMLVPELSSAMDDVGLRLTPDGTTLYLNYNANTSGGNADLYFATRTCN